LALPSQRSGASSYGSALWLPLITVWLQAPLLPDSRMKEVAYQIDLRITAPETPRFIMHCHSQEYSPPFPTLGKPNAVPDRKDLPKRKISSIASIATLLDASLLPGSENTD
jgi:hypothetical protein